MIVAKVDHWVKKGYFDQLETMVIEDVTEFTIKGDEATIRTEKGLHTIKDVKSATLRMERKRKKWKSNSTPIC